MKRSIPLLLVLFAPIFVSWSLPAYSAPDGKTRQQIEQIRLRSGELPVVKLNADMLYRILASEIAAQRGRFDMASQTFLDLARETSDPRLAKRAFQFSMADRDMARSLKAAREWALLAPGDPEAVASALALAASNGQTAGLASALRTRIEKAENKEQAVIQASAIVGKMADKRVAFEVLEKALPPSVRSLPVAHLALADAAWAALEPTRALQEARQALALDPESEPAAQRVLEYGLKVDSIAAIDETRAYIKKHPDSRKLQLMLVNRLVDRHDFNAALEQVNAMRQRSPEDFDLLYTEAEVNMRSERYPQAQALLEEYISVQTQRRKSINDKATNAMADASDARLLLVQIAEKQNRLGDAIAQLDLIDEPSLRFQAQVHKAVLQARMGNIALARRSIESLKPQDNNERSVVALTLASIYREAGRTDTAVEILLKADSSIPDTAEIKYDLAMLYERQGKFQEFERLMRRVIELDPNNANAYNSLGYTYADQNRKLDEAEDLLERALELDPGNPFILDSVGWYLYRSGDFEAALEYLQRSYDQMPSADVAAHLGEVLWVSKRPEDARRIWQAGMAKEPQNETLLKTLKRLGVTLK
ncbi:tetratricopeptide repeat protein [Candidimonas sp. SYP-B2681]|uniref:tetratricopeptide repeat protein n=1 Tax=Candidimonas sp. SYP-B2681 TaxID=2497686 RepID=UPI000F866865|nr:tetratricopeptide repeat protein [Candidimonas sp. SYP-B2681]RTZ40665.1 tetratricopeptide repeat protein [Candidimonas sp. SYP-B2681]